MKDILRTLTSKALIPATAAASATVTGSGAGIIDLSGVTPGTLKFILDSTAGGAGATLDVQIQDSADGSTGWAAAPANQSDLAGETGHFTQVGNAAAYSEIGIQSRQLRRYIRAVGTIAGTATFTFSVHVIYQKQQL